jgi:cytochrome c oxidase assembly protein Cox11
MNIFSIRFWFFYITIIVIFQMFFFTIYNIPIYKIYCELNNYYLNDIITYNKFNLKYILYINIQNINSCFLADNQVEINNSYFLFSNYVSPNIKDLYLTKLYCNFDIYNIFVNVNIQNIKFIFNIYNFIISFLENYKVENLQTQFSNFFYIVYFNTSVTNLNSVEFISLQNNIYIVPGETYLVFFRLYNPTNFIIKGISIYFISPNEISAYLFKIQCFCFDELILYQFESIDLPILFYISSDVLFVSFESFIYFQIQIIYLFILNTF